jgi:hypothetical protein
MTKRKPKTVKPTKVEIVESDGLTIKQRLFINHYLVCMNGTEAARLAGYEGNDVTLASVASHNLRNHNVLRALDERLNAFTMSANEVLIRLTDIARGDIGDALNSAGGIDPLEAKMRGKSHLIKKFKTKSITTEEADIHEAEIEMYDAQAALTTLLKFHGLVVDRVKVEDWRTDIIALLKDGKITPEQVRDELGNELAEELFVSVGLSSVNT